jgi:uncharacterized protein YcnI
MSTHRINGLRVARWTAPVAVGLLALAAGAGSASAHVTANPGQAQKSGFAKIAFRVPNESSTGASTNKLEVDLPAAYPVASVSTKPMPGWVAQVTKVKLDKPIKMDNADITEAVSTVTWTATDPAAGIGPGQFNEFEVSMGPLPDNTEALIIPAIQSYTDNTVVKWDMPPAASGAPEPAHPAPVVNLVSATATAGNASDQHGGTAMGTSTSPQDDTARWLGGAGLLVGALGLGVAAGTALRARRRAGGGAGQAPGGSSA